MKGKEPPPYVHLRNSAEKRGRLGNDIKLENYTLQVPKRILLNDASLTLAYGYRYGFVGRNGLGKSSLLKAIADRYEGIQIAPHLRVLYVDQEVPGDDSTPIEHLLKADQELSWLMQEEEKLRALENDDPAWMDNPDEKRCYGLRDIHERLRDIEAHKAVPRATAILMGLGFEVNAISNRPCREFSGGWRMRVSLARALFCRPDVLLLDEPTNHLDLHACFWLEKYLSKWKSTLLVVSHEAAFLNEVANRIVEIRNRTLTTYKGDYWTYEKAREVNARTKENEAERISKGSKVPMKDKDAPKVPPKSNGGKIIPSLIDDPGLNRVSFPEPDIITAPIIQFKEVSFGYDPSKPIFNQLEFRIDMESRIGLVGLNGVGKSTLMKLMAGELKETNGYIERNRKARWARFSQHSLEQLNPLQTPAQYIKGKFSDANEYAVRGLLGRFGICGDWATKSEIKTLSGGQKSRVVVAELAYEHPHVLLLDEPSNHLDLEAIEALAQGLKAYPGGVVLITHNQRLLSLVCTDVWVVTTAGRVEKFSGGFEDYKKEIMAKWETEESDEEEEEKSVVEEKKATKEKAKN